MKRSISIIFLCSLFMGSCFKTSTCKDATGATVSKTESKTTNKNSKEAVEKKCRETTTETVINGTVTATTPCEVG